MASAYLHVNSNTIKSNLRSGANEPPLSIRKTRSAPAEKCHEMAIYGADGALVARVIYCPDRPLPCGAKVWIEVEDGCTVAVTA